MKWTSLPTKLALIVMALIVVHVVTALVLSSTALTLAAIVGAAWMVLSSKGRAFAAKLGRSTMRVGVNAARL